MKAFLILVLVFISCSHYEYPVPEFFKPPLPEGAKFDLCCRFGYSYDSVCHNKFTYVQRFIIKSKSYFWEPTEIDTVLCDEFWEDSSTFFPDYKKSRSLAYSKNLWFVFLIEPTDERAAVIAEQAKPDTQQPHECH